MRAPTILAVVAAVVLGGRGLRSAPQRGVQTTAPEDLGILESPDREQWQQPEAIMDALGIADGSRVADLGAGGGWFTVRLGHRVGPNGVVYAVDIQSRMIDAIMRRVRDHGLANVCPILGAEDDPHLPTLQNPEPGAGRCKPRPPTIAPPFRGLDAVLMVDTYPQISDPVTVLRHVAESLAPTGRVGIVDFRKDGAGGPGPPLTDRIDPDVIRDHAKQAGLALLREETFLRYQFLLIFGRAPVTAPGDPAAARFSGGSTRPRTP
jgi:SAM-dependent methyltransferase